MKEILENTEKNPLVSVGIPTYNRPEGLKRTLENITQQTYKNLEIIISDNCSVGSETKEIIRGFAANDKRINFFLHEKNFGPAFNFQFVLDKANGEYFMWAADDDGWDKTYISKCIKKLIENPEVVLCSTWASFIDSNQNIVKNEYYEDIDTLGLEKIPRLKKVIRGVVQNTHYYGLRRTYPTKKIEMRKEFGLDHVFMMQLSYYGSFVIIPEVLFFCNITGAGSNAEKNLDTVGIKSVLVRISPSFSIMRSYFKEILSTKCLSGKEKLFAIIYVIERYTTKPYIFEIIRDIRRLPAKLLGRSHKRI